MASIIIDEIVIDETARTIQAEQIQDVVIVNPVSQSAVEIQTAIAKNAAAIDSLEHQLSTAYISGAELSINAIDNKKFDISAGVGVYVDHSQTHPLITPVTISAQIGVSLPTLGTIASTELGVDKNGNFVFQNTYTSTERRDIFTLGTLVHTSNVIIESISQGTRVIERELALSLADFAIAVGPIVKSGAVVSANGVNLKIDVSSGDVFGIGIQRYNIKNPNYVTTDPSIATLILYTWRDGSGGYVIAPSTDIIPSRFDDGTGGTTIPNGIISSNKWSRQRVFWVPRQSGTELNLILIQFGTAEYADATAAISSLEPDFIFNPALQNTLKRADIAVRGGALDLSIIGDALFLNADKFGRTNFSFGL